MTGRGPLSAVSGETWANTSPFLPEDAVTVIELLKRTSGDPDLWTAEERRAVMRLAALREETR